MSSNSSFDLKQHPHRRYNPLTREWVLVSPHRTQRPWQGQVEKHEIEKPPRYDPECYLCPGNRRAGGVQNPLYADTFVFQNDYSALLSDTPPGEIDLGIDGHQNPAGGRLIFAKSERGICRVVCFSPRHDLTISRMSIADLRKVVEVWITQFVELSKMPWIKYVQIFENRGAMMGASNPHPHCQIWTNESLPNEPTKEEESFRKYRNESKSCLLCDYLRLERAATGNLGNRFICENDFFSALVPFWAVWPFETMIISRRHLSGIDELTSEERTGLADILKRLTTRYDNIFEVPFPYSMGFHQRPVNTPELSERENCHLHAHFYPPLLRSATVRKFMVGYEMLGTPQRDISAETAAERLRDVGETHYLGTSE